MTRHIDELPPMSVGEQAAAWLLRWHSGDLTTAERHEYLQWLKTSPVHIAETLRVCRSYSWLASTKLQLFFTNEDSFSNLVELPPPTDVQRVDPFEAKLASAARSYPVDTDTLVRNAREALAERRVWRWARVAVAVATVLFIGFIRALAPVEAIQTEAGEWRQLVLEDGTEVMLGPHSRARPEYEETRRGVLVERGEAFFKVAKDPRRPFLARTQRVTARAVGTQFGISVAGTDGAVTVTVQEGHVAVWPSDRPAEPLAIAAGEQLKVENSWPIAPRLIDPERELAWSRKRLSFGVGDTLGSAVRQFNQRNVIQIELDQTLVGRPVRGEFDANDPLSFAQSVTVQADVVVTRSADTVRLEVKEQPPGEMHPGARHDG